MVIPLLALNALAFDPSTVDTSDFSELGRQGQIVIVEENDDGSLKMITGGAVLDATPSAVWTVLMDFDGYSDWMPDVEKVAVVNDFGGVKDVEYDLSFKFSVISKSINYTLRTRIDAPGQSFSWQQSAGDFSKAEGSWNLVPIDGEQRTLAFYSTVVDLESMGWIVRGIIKEQPAMNLAIQSSTAVMVIKALQQHMKGLE
jgi:ribosome-associated toxin RatA of RatAB toxin-antitoxin module